MDSHEVTPTSLTLGATAARLEPAEREQAAGGRMRRLANCVGVIGYGSMDDGNCFLEMRVDADQKIVPDAASFDAILPGFAQAMTECRWMLSSVAMAAIRAAAVEAGVPDVEEMMSLVDDGKDLGKPGREQKSKMVRACCRVGNILQWIHGA